MKFQDVVKLAKEEGWQNGSTWEFDLYIDQLFVEIMAFGNNPVKIDYHQPIFNDEFLNNSFNDGLLSRFSTFLETESAMLDLLEKQNKIILRAQTFLTEFKLNPHLLDYKSYKEIQSDLSLLMASVSVVFDPLISDYISTLSQENNLELEQISAYIIQKSGVTALNESNNDLLSIYKKNKELIENAIADPKKFTKEIEKLLEDHVEKYGWINTGEKGRKPWTTSDFLEQLEEIRTIEKPVKVKLSPEVEKLLVNPIKLNINDNTAADLQVELDYTFQKYLKNRFEAEYSEDIFENLTLDEIQQLDAGKGKVEDYKNRVNEHKIIVPFSGKVHVLWLSQEESKELKKILEDNSTGPENTEITGRPACPGLVEGAAMIVRNQKDLENFEKGRILVAEKTQPSYVMAMKKAIAIVTDIGGITSHAAIVSRELNIPCIVATENATKIIKNGDFIRVDAEKGTVVIL